MPVISNPWVLKKIMSLWPPFWGTGIRVQHVSVDFRQVIVEMRLTWYNKNYVGTHFGGSLFSMTDPFYMLMLMKVLGKGYYVWDKSGSIDFIKPGKSTVTAKFEISDVILDDILKGTVGGDKFFKDISVDLVDESNDVVARVSRKLYIRKKKTSISS